MHKVTFILLIIGGLAWGLELFGYGPHEFLPEMLTMVIYALVALSALYELFTHKSYCKNCSAQGAM